MKRILRAAAIAGCCGGRHGARHSQGSILKSAINLALAEAPESDPGDLFAEMLRSALRGNLPPTPGDTSNLAAEEARQAALQFARLVPALAGQTLSEDLDDTRLRLALRERHDAHAIVLARDAKLFGREEEWRRIDDFLGEQATNVSPLLITGIGGIGKSTLLVALVRALAERHNGPSVILLDFDRPAISNGDPIEIVREFTRQLSFEWLTAKSIGKQKRQEGNRILRDKRSQLSATRELGGKVTRLHAEEQFSRLQSLIFVPFRTELPLVLREAPIVLIMDTFEVVGMRGPETINRILDLEATLRDGAGFKRLRTIVSGRGIPLPEGIAIQKFGSRERWLELEGLEAEAGAEFLASRDLRKRFRTKGQRLQAAKALKGHPLALVVLEKYARNRTMAELADLLNDIQSNAGFSAHCAQTFLYSRILERISDKRVRALAHPGLVLRHVTPDLIRLVLAGPCGLAPMSIDESKKLFDQLKQEDWLVDILGESLVRHRPDLRRLMLPSLFAAPLSNDPSEVAARKIELRKAAVAACRAAGDFYRDGPQANDRAYRFWDELGDKKRRGEQLYYEALSGVPAPTDLSREYAADVRDEIGEDLDGMPSAWRALIKAVLGQAGMLSDDEVATLGGPLRDAVESSLIDADLSQGETARARQRTRAEQARKDTTRAPAKPGRGTKALRVPISDDKIDLIEKEVRAAFNEADIDAVGEVGQPLLDAFRDGRLTDLTKQASEAGRLWETAFWKILVVGTVMGSRSPIDKLAIPISTEAAIEHWPFLFFARKKAVLDQTEKQMFVDRHDRIVGLDRTRYIAGGLASGIVSWGITRGGVAINADSLALGDHWLWSAHAVRKRGRWAYSLGDRPSEDATNREKATDTKRRYGVLDYLRLNVGIQFGPRVSEFVKYPPFGKLTIEALQKFYQSIAEEQVRLGGPTKRRLKPASLDPILAFLRGLTPELYQPLRYLLTSRPNELAIELSNRLAERNPLWPDELVFGERNKNSYTVRHALPLIETADRCGLLRFMLLSLPKREPRVAKLLAIYDAITERLFKP